MAPSSPKLPVLWREHSNCTSGAQRAVDSQLRPPRNSAFGLFVRRMGSGKQNHQCKACERQFSGTADDRLIADERRTRVEHLLRERVSLRGICRAVGVSLTWLLHFMVEC